MVQKDSSEYRKIRWCSRKNKGIAIIKPNPNLSRSYMENSKEDFLMILECKSIKWKIIASYYCCYNALYSVLQKTGIKSEIHDCTIELMRLYDFDEKDMEFMIDLKNKRENAQYYNKIEDISDKKDIYSFILKCKDIIRISDHKEILESLKEIIK